MKQGKEPEGLAWLLRGWTDGLVSFSLFHRVSILSSSFSILDFYIESSGTEIAWLVNRLHCAVFFVLFILKVLALLHV